MSDQNSIEVELYPMAVINLITAAVSGITLSVGSNGREMDIELPKEATAAFCPLMFERVRVFIRLERYEEVGP